MKLTRLIIPILWAIATLGSSQLDAAPPTSGEDLNFNQVGTATPGKVVVKPTSSTAGNSAPDAVKLVAQMSAKARAMRKLYQSYLVGFQDFTLAGRLKPEYDCALPLLSANWDGQDVTESKIQECLSVVGPEAEKDAIRLRALNRNGINQGLVPVNELQQTDTGLASFRTGSHVPFTQTCFPATEEQLKQGAILDLKLFEDASRTSNGCRTILSNELQTIVATYNSHTWGIPRNQISSEHAAVVACGASEPILHDVKVSSASTTSGDFLLYEPSLAKGSSDIKPCEVPFDARWVLLDGRCNIDDRSVDQGVLSMCNLDGSAPIGYVIKDASFGVEITTKEHWFPVIEAIYYYLGMPLKRQKMEGHENKQVGQIPPKGCVNIQLQERLHGNHLDIKIKCGSVSRRIARTVDNGSKCSAAYNYKILQLLCEHWISLRLLVVGIASGLIVAAMVQNPYFGYARDLMMPIGALVTAPFTYSRSLLCPDCGSPTLALWAHQCGDICSFCNRHLDEKEMSGHHCRGKRDANLQPDQRYRRIKDPRTDISYVRSQANRFWSTLFIRMLAAYLLLLLVPKTLALHATCNTNNVTLDTKSAGSVTVPYVTDYIQGLCTVDPLFYIEMQAAELCQQYTNPAVKASVILQRMQTSLLPGEFLRNVFWSLKNKKSQQDGCLSLLGLMRDIHQSYDKDGGLPPVLNTESPLVDPDEQSDQPTDEPERTVHPTSRANTVLERTLLSYFNEPAPPVDSSPTRFAPYAITSSLEGDKINMEFKLPLVLGTAYELQAVGKEGNWPFKIRFWVQEALHVMRYIPQYKTCSDGGASVRSTHTCASSCETCLTNLRTENSSTQYFTDSQTAITKTWDRVNNWSCEGKGCMWINSGCLCAACIQKRGKDCSDVVEVHQVEAHSKICVTVNEKSGCKKVYTSALTSRNGLNIDIQLSPVNAILSPGQLVAREISTNRAFSGPIARIRSNEVSFGQPQYTYDSDELMHHFPDTDSYTFICHGQSDFEVHVESCYVQTYNLMDSLTQIPYTFSEGQYLSTGEAGTAKFSFQIPRAEYKWAETSVSASIKSVNMRQCKDCGTAGELKVTIESKGSGYAYLTCEGVSVESKLVMLKPGLIVHSTLADLEQKVGQKFTCRLTGNSGDQLSDISKMVDHSMLVRGRNISELTTKRLARSIPYDGPVSSWWPSWFHVGNFSAFITGLGFYIQIVLAVIVAFLCLYLVVQIKMLVR